MLKAEIGETAVSSVEKVQARAEEAKPTACKGRPEKGTKVVPFSKGGNDQIVAQIAKKRPDVLDPMKAGEFTRVTDAERNQR